MANERRSLDELHPKVREAVKNIQDQLDEEKLPFAVFEAYRTPQRQRALFRQGGVTNADAWQSYHQYGLAVDFVFKDKNGWSWDTSGGRMKLWERMNAIGRAHGLEPLSWEKPHLQLAGIRLADLRAGRYPEGGDQSWAQALCEAIESYPDGAPPLPDVGPTRPPILSPQTHDTRPAHPPLEVNLSRQTFERAQAIIKQYEGGFAHHPADPGGATNWGITHVTLATWRGVASVDAEDVRRMSYEEAKDIYFARYLNALQCGALPAPLALALYNAGVHCGIKVAAGFLQSAVIAQGVRIEHDLDIGPETIRGVARCDAARLMESVIDDYEARLRAHPRFDVFGNGFMNRVHHLRRECANWLAEGSPAPVVQPKEKTPMPAPALSEEVLPLLARLLELLRRTVAPELARAPAPVPAAALDPTSAALIQSVLAVLSGKVPDSNAVAPAILPSPTPPLGPVNGALGQWLGTLLNGRKSAIGIIGSVLLGILQQSPPDGIASKLSAVVNAAVPMLGGASGPLLPVFLGIGAWGLLGKLEKYQLGLQAKK